MLHYYSQRLHLPPLCAAIMLAVLTLDAPSSAAADDLAIVAKLEEPRLVAKLVYGEQEYDYRTRYKLEAALKQRKVSGDARPLTFTAPPHVDYGQVEPALRLLAEALPDHRIILESRVDPKQAVALRKDDADITMTPGRTVWEPILSIIDPDAADARKVDANENAKLAAPIRVQMSAQGNWNVRMSVEGHNGAIESMAELRIALRTLLQSDSGHTIDSPVLISPATDVPWSHVVQVMATARLNRFRTIQLAPRQHRFTRGLKKPAPPPPGPPGAFFGRGGSARKIIYIVDGPLDPALCKVMAQYLLKSASDLLETQQYAIIVSDEEEPAVMEPDAELEQWLSAEFPKRCAEIGGGKRLVRAVKLAMEYRPDLVFLISRQALGEGDDAMETQELLGELARINPLRRYINTAGIFDQPLDADSKPATALIAEQTGGRHSPYIRRKE